MNNTIMKVIFVLLIVGLITIIFISQKESKVEEEYDFEMYFFNAGKADAILIQTNDHYMMIDTGEKSLATTILKYFEEHKIKKLDYLIITHFDKDHVGSAADIIDSVEIGEVLQSNVEKENEYYTAYLKALEKKQITPKTITGDYHTSMETIDININGPTIVYDKNESNNSSLITSLSYVDTKFLLMGDCENKRIKDFNEINNLEYDFLKVPYHGNKLKQLENLLKERNIKYAVITSSNQELESSETTNLLKENNIKTYLTRKGAIRVLSNGEQIIIKQ